MLRGWKAALAQVLAARGFELQPSVTPFFVARPPQGLQAAALREAGIAVRDATSFGLPGCWRLSAQPGDAMKALAASMDKERAAC